MVAAQDVENDVVNSDFVPFFQKISGVLALCNATLLLLLGGMFLFVPRMVLSVLLDYIDIHDPSFTHILTSNASGRELHQMSSANGEDPLDSVTRMIGCILLGQGLSCLLLVYPLLVEESSSQRHSRLAVWNVRTSIVIQGVTGLLWIVVGLWDDRANEASQSDVVVRRNTLGLLLVGFIILLLACLSLMMSFWPVHQVRMTEGMADVHMSSNGEASTSRGDFLEPLLSADDRGNNQHNNDDDNQVHDDGMTATCNVDDQGAIVNHYFREAPVAHVEETASMDLSETAPEGTSRIRGTRRLLKLAAPQVIYLYVGCITLLIRLPFSLSIPHFVATTLGALSQGEFDRARREISWLFILGTIDAWYVYRGYFNSLKTLV
jgi:hypothetical protein